MLFLLALLEALGFLELLGLIELLEVELLQMLGLPDVLQTFEYVRIFLLETRSTGIAVINEALRHALLVFFFSK